MQPARQPTPTHAPQPMARREVVLLLATGPVVVQVEVPAAEVPPSALLPALWALVDALVAQAGRLARTEGRVIQCRPGCAVCCNQLVPVSEPEMHAIWGLMLAMDPARRAQISARFTAAMDAFVQAGLDQALRSPPSDPAAYRQMIQAYFELSLPCPFVEDGACSIHASRPSICREYNITSPPELCADPFQLPLQHIPPPFHLSNAIAPFLQSLRGRATKISPMILAPEWAAQHPEGSTGLSGPELLWGLVAHIDRLLGSGGFIIRGA